MSTFKKIIYAAFVLVLANGCRKALDTAPTNSLPVEQAFSTADKCLASLNGVYDAAQSGPYTDGTVRGYPFGAASIEQGDMRGEDMLNIAAFYQVTYQATYNSSSPNNIAMWNTLYLLINRANICIDGFRNAAVQGVITSAVALQYEGECRFMRAMAHHELLIHFARPYADNNGINPGVPYRDFAITTPDKVELARTIPRMRVDSVYKRILADLDSAELRVPVTVAPATVRVNRVAAIALKMRVKLHMGDWAGVTTEGNKLINTAALTPATPQGTTTLIGNYSLTANPDGPFSNNASSESIFSIKNDALDNTGVNGALPSMYGSSDLGGRGLVAVSPIFWNNNTAWLCDDKRRTLLYGLGLNTNGPGNINVFTNKYRKYNSREDYAPMIRLAEVYLMMAEARVRTLGVDQTGVDLLNMVRNRSLLVPATQQFVLANFATPVALIKAILAERRIEFLGEGRRWSDITRLALDPNYSVGGIPAKAANGTVGQLLYSYNTLGVFICPTSATAPTIQAAIPYTDFKFIWPIPSDEITQNPIITQNPFY